MLKDYIELSREMYGEESTHHAYSHFLMAKSIMQTEYTEEEGETLLKHITKAIQIEEICTET